MISTHLYSIFAYINPLPVDIHNCCWNVSINFGCAFYLKTSSFLGKSYPVLFLFLRVIQFYTYFCFIHVSVLSFSTGCNSQFCYLSFWNYLFHSFVQISLINIYAVMIIAFSLRWSWQCFKDELGPAVNGRCDSSWVGRRHGIGR